MDDTSLKILLYAELIKPLFHLKYEALKKGIGKTGPLIKQYYAGYYQALLDYKAVLDRTLKGDPKL